MTDGPDYVVVGRGRWGERMKSVLDGLGRRVTVVPHSPRRHPASESDSHYEARMTEVIAGRGGSVAWLCVPPGDHVTPLIRVAVSSGMHVIVEKPWLCSEEETAALVERARQAGRVIGVHFEYCLLEGVQRWRDQLEEGRHVAFGGRFTTPATDRMGVPAEVNLGCHLRAVHEYAVPQARIAELVCAYEKPAQRVVWVEPSGGARQEIDFTRQHEPIIQRFVTLFEKCVGTDSFPFGPSFARRASA
jgi:hypothetical protein